MRRFLHFIARWYYMEYLRPLILDDLKAQLAKSSMPRKRYIGEP